MGVCAKLAVGAGALKQQRARGSPSTIVAPFGQISHSEIAMLLKPAGASISRLMSLGIKKSWCEISAKKNPDPLHKPI